MRAFQASVTKRGDRMQRLIVSILSLALTFASFIARASGDARTTELLAQARAALGGEPRLAKVQGLSAAGTFQRQAGERQLQGELTVDVQLPDKMVRTESMNTVGGATLVMQTQQVQRGAVHGAQPGSEQPAPQLPFDAPQIVDITMFLDDYRSVDGVLLPHHLSRSIDGRPNEEWTFKTIKLNPAFRADTFSGNRAGGPGWAGQAGRAGSSSFFFVSSCLRGS